MSALPKYRPELDHEIDPRLDEGRMGLLEHLEELRRRIMLLLYAISIGVAWAVAPRRAP